MTYAIDDLKPGMSDGFTKTVSERDIALFGEATGDMNPVHFDEEFAKRTAFRGRIAHGALTVGFLSAVLGNRIPGPGTVVLSLSTRLLAAVRIGDTVSAICTVREVLPKRRVIFDCVCKVGDTVVLEGEALVVVPFKAR
jgi:3-hydroxybutyryl-CoA dehydratase